MTSYVYRFLVNLLGLLFSKTWIWIWHCSCSWKLSECLFSYEFSTRKSLYGIDGINYSSSLRIRVYNCNKVGWCFLGFYKTWNFCICRSYCSLTPIQQQQWTQQKYCSLLLTIILSMLKKKGQATQFSWHLSTYRCTHMHGHLLHAESQSQLSQKLHLMLCSWIGQSWRLELLQILLTRERVLLFSSFGPPNLNQHNGSVIVWTPHFGSMRFPLDGELDFYFKIWFLLIIWKWLGVATYFCFIFKG